MTVADLLRSARQRFSAISDSPRLDAELLLADILNWRRSQLLTRDSEKLPAGIQERAESIFKRREAGEPVAYLLGRQGFWSVELDVGPEVLIPRPETELLLELALDVCTPTARVLDLGTGSGALAICLAKECPTASITATDHSVAALERAKANAQRLRQGHIRFVEGDWFSALLPDDVEPFDLIVSNPPYIADQDEHLKALQYEPREALVSGADGLRDLYSIIAAAPDRLCLGGWLMLEHGFDQAAAVRQRMSERGFEAIETFRDLSQHERVTRGKRI